MKGKIVLGISINLVKIFSKTLILNNNQPNKK